MGTEALESERLADTHGAGVSRAVVGAVVTWLFVVIVAVGILAVGNSPM